MDIHKLKAFVAVVEENNISRAAVRLNMQQPPLTRIIKGLEDEADRAGANVGQFVGNAV